MSGRRNIASLGAIALVLWCPEGLLGQNLEKLDKKGERVKVSGGIRMNTMAYFVSGMPQRRDPFGWTVNGNINVSILDVALPFTFTYSNLGASYTQPFNMTALHPKYKWAQAHLGLTSMSFSPYTLSGRTFLGAGADLTPGKWKISFMGGRLAKAIPFSQEHPVESIAYRRWGGAIKLGYDHKGYGFEFIALKATDQANSLTLVPESSSLTPQDNMVLSLSAKATPVKGLVIKAECALSALTGNTLSADEGTGKEGSFMKFLVTQNATTALYHAVNGSIGYNWKWLGVQAKYERVQPGYATLGGFYFNNDLENYTIAPSFKLLKGKVNLAINTGFQRNDLDGGKSAATKRWVGSINLASSPVKGLSLSGSYSNFSTFTRNRPSTDPFYFQPADTMNFYQINQTATVTVGYQFGSKDFNNVIQCNGTLQESENITGAIPEAGAFGLNISATGQQATVYLAMLTYSGNWTKKQMGVSVTGNLNRSYLLMGVSTFLGPTISWHKSILGKAAKILLGSTYNLQFMDETRTGNILNHRLGFSYNPTWWDQKYGKMSFGLNANWLQRLPMDSNSTMQNEVNLFCNVNYTIG